VVVPVAIDVVGTIRATTVATAGASVTVTAMSAKALGALNRPFREPAARRSVLTGSGTDWARLALSVHQDRDRYSKYCGPWARCSQPQLPSLRSGSVASHAENTALRGSSPAYRKVPLPFGRSGHWVGRFRRTPTRARAVRIRSPLKPERGSLPLKSPASELRLPTERVGTANHRLRDSTARMVVTTRFTPFRRPRPHICALPDTAYVAHAFRTHTPHACAFKSDTEFASERPLICLRCLPRARQAHCAPGHRGQQK